MKDNLRTPAQGADTVVWLAISKAALKHPSGLFFQGECLSLGSKVTPDYQMEHNGNWVDNILDGMGTWCIYKLCNDKFFCRELYIYKSKRIVSFFTLRKKLNSTSRNISNDFCVITNFLWVKDCCKCYSNKNILFLLVWGCTSYKYQVHSVIKSLTSRNQSIYLVVHEAHVVFQIVSLCPPTSLSPGPNPP